MKLNRLKKINLKTIYFNFRVFSFSKAIKLPVFLAGNTVIHNLSRGGVQLYGDIKPGMLQIGFSDWVNAFDVKKDCCIINFQKGSVIKVRGNVRIGPGAEINIGDNAILDLGNQVSINARCHIECHNFIKIGNNVLISWDCEFMDTDFHHIGEADMYGTINIDSNVWICCKCTILKNVYIPNGSVIGATSLVCKKLTEENSLYAGVPAILVKNCIKWRR